MLQNRFKGSPWMWRLIAGETNLPYFLARTYFIKTFIWTRLGWLDLSCCKMFRVKISIAIVRKDGYYLFTFLHFFSDFNGNKDIRTAGYAAK